MDVIKTIWNLLNGKKTTIAALLMLAAQALEMTGYGEWSEVVLKLIEILNGAGISLAGIGLTHKGAKYVDDKLG